MGIKVLVVGATGITGTSFLQHCLNDKPPATLARDGAPTVYNAPHDWHYIGLTRQTNRSSPHHRLQYVSVDLLEDCTSLQSLSGITHIVFAGFVPEPDPERQLIRNAALLENCLHALRDQPLEHIVLLQGMKYYGSHKGRFKTPARESDPRIDEPHYYYTQQDIVMDSGIDWTCLRPHVICGSAALGTPQNILAVIGCYASLCKAANQRLHWPGSEASFNALNQASDANLLAQSIVWALQSKKARNEAFNVTNGDFFRWNSLWPRIANALEMPVGDCKPQILSQSMRNSEQMWQTLVVRHQLKNHALQQICDWNFADYILKTEWDVMASTVKIRQAGFHRCTDTEEMYLNCLYKMREEKIIP